MSSLRSRFLPKFHRSPSVSSDQSTASSPPDLKNDKRTRSKTSLLLSKTRQSSLASTTLAEDSVEAPPPTTPSPATESPNTLDQQEQTPQTSLEEARVTPPKALPPKAFKNPLLTIQAPTPTPPIAKLENEKDPIGEVDGGQTSPGSLEPLKQPQAPELPRRQSLAAGSQKKFLDTLLESDRFETASPTEGYSPNPLSVSMLHRKIWVKRPGASATLVLINEDDLVDDVRDRILKKYGNSLGRSFDPPDVTLRIIPREPRDHPRRQSQGERVLGPEESMSRTLDSFYPGGQNVDEALIVDVPRRTPNHSPRPVQYVVDNRPVESGTDYFPVIPPGQHSPHLPSNLSVSSGHAGSHHAPSHSISILNTGQVPPLPSPGGTRSARFTHRPKFNRQHTTSPSVHSVISGSQIHDPTNTYANGIPIAPEIPSPSLPIQDHNVATPPPRPASPRVRAPQKNAKKAKNESSGLLNGAVPPINVLIVEDNIINLKLLEAFMKRLKVRWHTAMNGREAVQKWRNGGFHLVLMDIQLPVMNGLDATKEIRRLERVNNIGAFSYEPTTPSANGASPGEQSRKEDDALSNRSVFLSPVIIVALTASSLQSDRHEALAAGCNDFLTKPVNFVWLERKVMEWGCMQALIDFDGWRKWKDFSTPAAVTASTASNNNNTSTPAKRHSPGNTRGNSIVTPVTKSASSSSTSGATIKQAGNLNTAATPASGKGAPAGAATTPSPPTGKASSMVDGTTPSRSKRVSTGSYGKAGGVSALEVIRADSNEDDPHT